MRVVRERIAEGVWWSDVPKRIPKPQQKPQKGLGNLGGPCYCSALRDAHG